MTTIFSPLISSADDDKNEYQNWRTHKLDDWPNHSTQLFVTIQDPMRLSQQEKEQLLRNCSRTGMSFYRTTTEGNKSALKEFWHQLGIRTIVTNPCADQQGISTIQIEPEARYIPYTAKPLGWHTDGYYNTKENTIRAFAMHCISPATKGGSNAYFDPEILYILLRDENPDYITALAHPEAMVIPQNTLEEHQPRATTVTPVLTTEQNKLLIRYTERVHNITWRDDKNLQAALVFIREKLMENTPYRLSYKLKAGEGIICNNVLHNRTSFSNKSGTSRLLYRARFSDRFELDNIRNTAKR